MLDLKQLPPLSLYVHIPWCVKKCPYCDFNSHVHASGLPELEYVNALLLDLEHELPKIWGRDVISVFIGGGTPSLFSPESIDRLLSGLRAQLNLRPYIEITMEANPGTLEQSRLAEFCSVGINRLSLGVQSFNNDSLKQLGRIHNADEARRAIETAQQTKFDSINIDLMYGLPNQTIELALNDLQTAIDMAPQHISHYQLAIEPDTAFHRRPPTLPADENIWQMQMQSQSLLADARFQQYEVSAYAQSNHQCQHNLNYWRFGDYLGIGAGAHQKISSMQQRILRSWKHRLPQHYMTSNKENFTEGESELGKNDLIFEYMLNALRLTNGFESSLFYQHTGLPISCAESALQEAENKGLIQRSLTHIQTTDSGKQYLNELLMMFMD